MFLELISNSINFPIQYIEYKFECINSFNSIIEYYSRAYLLASYTRFFSTSSDLERGQVSSLTPGSPQVYIDLC